MLKHEEHSSFAKFTSTGLNQVNVIISFDLVQRVQ